MTVPEESSKLGLYGMAELAYLNSIYMGLFVSQQHLLLIMQTSTLADITLIIVLLISIGLYIFISKINIAGDVPTNAFYV